MDKYVEIGDKKKLDEIRRRIDTDRDFHVEMTESQSSLCLQCKAKYQIYRLEEQKGCPSYYLLVCLTESKKLPSRIT